MWFVCGLGNPGKKYLNTRHNVGFNIIDMIVEKYNFVKSKNDKSKEVYSGIISNQKFILCKPLNFMNLSGSVINDIIKYYKIPKSKIFIIHDDPTTLEDIKENITTYDKLNELNIYKFKEDLSKFPNILHGHISR